MTLVIDPNKPTVVRNCPGCVRAHELHPCYEGCHHHTEEISEHD